MERSAAVRNSYEIFLSYARKDGVKLAALLNRRAREAGHIVWQDVVDMQGGESWWLQIEERIEHAACVVFVLIPAALTSPIVQPIAAPVPTMFDQRIRSPPADPLALFPPDRPCRQQLPPRGFRRRSERCR